MVVITMNHADHGRTFSIRPRSRLAVDKLLDGTRDFQLNATDDAAHNATVNALMDDILAFASPAAPPPVSEAEGVAEAEVDRVADHGFGSDHEPDAAASEVCVLCVCVCV